MSESRENAEQRRKTKKIFRFEGGMFSNAQDFLATEEPLEIRIVYCSTEKRKDRSLSITMRTPGHDRELAAGFLLGEGVVKSANDIVEFESTGKPDETGETNQLCVHLAEEVEFDFGSLQRNFYMTSSCGICGTASLEAVRARLEGTVEGAGLKLSPTTICALPEQLRKFQQTFDETGGLHAAGLFDTQGKLLACREDVGRHNALDKLIGHRLLGGHLPNGDTLAIVSGRASFELVQKVISAGIPMLVAVGAPSSLAVELAEEFGVTLIGFTSSKRFNVYSHVRRIVEE